MAEQRGSGSRWDEYGRVSARFAHGYFEEVAPEDFRPTTERSLATHGLIDTTGEGDWQIVPLSLVDGSVSLLALPGDTFFGTRF